MAPHAVLVPVVKKIVDLGLAIKRAVDAAKRNERQCRRVEATVGRVCGLLQMVGVSEAHLAMLRHPCVAGALDDIVDSMEEALELVTKCQKNNSFLQFVTATGTEKKLRRVQEELLQKVSLCTLIVTTMSAVAMTNNRPQLSGQFGISNSRSELALHLRDTYTGGEGISSTCFLVTDQSRMGVAFAIRAAGIDFMIQLETNQLFAIAPLSGSNTDNIFSLLSALLEPFGQAAASPQTACFLGGDFSPYGLAELFTTPYRPRRQSVRIHEIHDTTDDGNVVPPAAAPPLLPAPQHGPSGSLAVQATDSSHLKMLQDQAQDQDQQEQEQDQQDLAQKEQQDLAQEKDQQDLAQEKDQQQRAQQGEEALKSPGGASE